MFFVEIYFIFFTIIETNGIWIDSSEKIFEFFEMEGNLMMITAILFDDLFDFFIFTLITFNIKISCILNIFLSFIKHFDSECFGLSEKEQSND